MTPRHRSVPSFGLPSASADGSVGLTTRQIGVCVLVLLVMVGASVWFAVAGQPSQAVQTRPFGGSLVLNDQQGPVVLDLASGTASIQLANVNRAVAASGPADVDAVPLSDGSLLINAANGTFNFLGQNDVLVAPTGGGVALSGSGFTSAAGFAAGSNAYVVGDAPSSASISLVNEELVALAARRTSTAVGASPTVQPVGTATATSPLDLGVGGSVTANGDLWTIAKNPQGHQVLQYSPAGAAKPLVETDRGTAPAVAALGAGVGPSGAQTVALATPNAIRVFPATEGSIPTTLTLPDQGAVTQIVPVSGAVGEVMFAYQSSGSWSLVGVTTTGSSRLSGPVALRNLPSSAGLLAPAFNDGSIYAVAAPFLSSHPRLVRIDPQTGDASPLGGEPEYPLVSSSEVPAFGPQTQVISIGPRVIFNNPDSILGVVVFTDGSHPPRTFDKGTLANVDPAAPGGVALNTAPKSRPQPRPKDQQVQAAVDPQSRCQNTSETPHRPVITTPLLPSTHTVTLSWSYQLLSNQDCEPTTYVVAASVVGDGPGPSQPDYQVQGQLSFIYPGLHPNVTYQFTVTAFIGHDDTTSLAQQITTAPQGPDKPTGVTATDADGTGWTVSWTACSAAACDANEPATQWTITGQTCAGDSFIGTPPSTTVAGSQESVTFPFALNPSLIGQDLTFDVQGTDVAGHAGDPATSNACVNGWSTPVAADITLSALDKPAPDFTDTATLTVTTASGVTAAVAFGSRNTDFTYSVTSTSGGQPVTQVGNPSGGPISSPTVTVTGLTPGATYATTVTVTPVGHPSAATSVSGSAITGVSSAWPGVSLVSSTTVLDPSADTGTLSATVAGAYGNIPAGQAVSLSASGAVSCSGTLMPGFSVPVTPGAGGTGTIGGIPLYLVTDGGSGCALILTLSESGSNFHGGPNSSNLALPVLGVQYPTPTVTADLQETPTCAFCVSVTAATALEAGTTSVGGAWTTTVQSTDGIDPVPCSETSPLSPADGGTMTAPVDMSACVENFENEDGGATTPVTVTFAVTVSWTYLGALSGPVPYTGPQLTTGPLTPSATTTTTTTTTLPPGPGPGP